MKEADPLAYMRNINTSPGPNAGRSIDPTRPGPDADRIAEYTPAPSPVREASRDDDEAAMVWNKIAPSEPQDVREAVASVLRRYGIAKSSAEHVAAQVLAALAQSTQPQDVRATDAMVNAFYEEMPSPMEIDMRDRDAAAHCIRAVLAQSDAQPALTDTAPRTEDKE